MLPSLYQISADLAALLESEEPDALEALDALFPALSTKAANVAAWVRYAEDMGQTLKAREQAFAAARKTWEANATRAREHLKKCMEQAEVFSITDERSGTTIKIVGNGGEAPVEIVDEEALRLQGYVQEVVPPLDKMRIRDDLKAGVAVEGARLGKRGTRLVLK